jgi:intracellular septation protein
MKNLMYAARPLALDMISTLVFVGIAALTHNPMLATAVAVAAGFGRIGYLWITRQPINAMQLMSLGLVVVFGAATLLTHNPRFMMAKPTIIYILIGSAMMQRGWMLPYMPPQGRVLGDGIMIRWGYVWAGMMFVTAILNAGFALLSSFAVWSSFIAIFPLVSKLGLFAVQFAFVRHAAVKRHRALAADAAAEAATPSALAA